jgi:hypothetical protein
MVFIDGAAMIVVLFGFEESMSHARIIFVMRSSQRPPVTLANRFADIGTIASRCSNSEALYVVFLNPSSTAQSTRLRSGERNRHEGVRLGKPPETVPETGRRESGL